MSRDYPDPVTGPRGDEFGIVTMAIGPDSIVRACAMAASVRIHEPDVPVMLITLDHVQVPGGCFDSVRRVQTPEPFSDQFRFLNKLVHPFTLSPYRRTLFLDDDTLLVRPVRPVLEEHFFGRDFALNTFAQKPEDSCVGKNFLHPGATAQLTGRPLVDNPYGGGHYYYERGDRLDEIIRYALEFATDRPGDYVSVACPGQRVVADEIAALFAINALDLPMPRLPDFVDSLNLARGNAISLDVSAGRYVWDERPWGSRIGDVRILHFCTNGKRSLAYSREIHRLTGRRQSFDVGIRGVARRARHTLAR